MSKKKNKFKRSKHNHGPVHNIPPRIEQIERQPIEKAEPEENEEKSVNVKKIEQTSPQEAATYAYVRKDVKKILWFILLIIVLLTAAYFIDTKTILFQTFGDWIYKIAHIQTL